MMDKDNRAEPKVWQKPEILQSFTEAELEEQLKGRDLRVHGAGTFGQGSFKNRNDS
jgi:hypothetical protein